MNDTIAETTDSPGAALERVLVAGDLSKLSPEQRVSYYGQLCRSLGLNALTRPFEYLVLNGKTVLYARRDATDQLRVKRSVSIASVSHTFANDLCLVTVTAVDGDGRSDTATGAVEIKGKVGEALANAIMKAETKAKRRVTLSLCGLGILDETELDDIDPIAAPRDVTPPKSKSGAGEGTGVPTAAGGPTYGAVPVGLADLKADAHASAQPISEAQLKRLYTRAGQQGWQSKVVGQLIGGELGVKPEALSRKAYEGVVAWFDAHKPTDPIPQQQAEAKPAEATTAPAEEKKAEPEQSTETREPGQD